MAAVRAALIVGGLVVYFTSTLPDPLISGLDKRPPNLTILASDGTVMAVEHRSLPLAAVQFHPESILSLDDDFGIRLVRNVMRVLAA